MGRKGKRSRTPTTKYQPYPATQDTRPQLKGTKKTRTGAPGEPDQTATYLFYMTCKLIHTRQRAAEQAEQAAAEPGGEAVYDEAGGNEAGAGAKAEAEAGAGAGGQQPCGGWEGPLAELVADIQIASKSELLRQHVVDSAGVFVHGEDRLETGLDYNLDGAGVAAACDAKPAPVRGATLLSLCCVWGLFDHVVAILDRADELGVLQEALNPPGYTFSPLGKWVVHARL